MADRIEECQMMIAAWYTGQPIITIRMDGGDDQTELCIQLLMIELLRRFVDNPIPAVLVEGSNAFNTWIDMELRKAMHGLDFGLNEKQLDAVKNLAFNYWVEGVSKVQATLPDQSRLFKCWRNMLEVKH